MGCAYSITPAVIKPQTPININMFVVNGLIGEGGFGKVMTALFVKNNNWYAVKEIKKTEITKHKTGLQMILGEINAMKRLDHPFIVSLHFAFQNRPNCYMILDLKTGGDLRYYLKRKLLFEERDIAFYVACVSSALDHIHSRNIIHRDIKPENIILDERGYPHLADFGVAHVQALTDDEAASGSLTSYLASGTKQYLAPEVFTKSHVHGPESDFWSLGVVAYELLYGKRPFEKHAPIQFITYLEKGLDRRRRLRETMVTAKSKHAAATATTKSSSGSFSGSPKSAPGSPCTATTDGPRSESFSSPCGSERSSFDLSASGVAMSPSQLSVRLNSSGGKKGGGGVLPGLFPTIQHTMSTDGGSTTPSEGNSFCTSVGYTRLQTISSSLVSASKRAFIGGGIAGRESEGPMLNLSIDVSMAEKPTVASTANDDGVSRLTHLAGICTKTFSRGGGRNKSMLPCLSPSRSATTPRSIYKIPESANSFYVPEDDQAGSGPHKVESSDAHRSQQETSTQQLFVRTHPTRAAPGDHWVVDEGALPTNLVFNVPTSNAWLGTISQPCIDMLEGLFEMRPSHRLGARNIGALKNHPWLAEHGLCNWAELRTKALQPNFRPGKKFIREIMEEQNHAAMYRHCDNDGGGDTDSPTFAGGSGCSREGCPLSVEEERQFLDFKYTAPAYRDMFRDEAAAQRDLVVRDKHTLEQMSKQCNGPYAGKAVKI